MPCHNHLFAKMHISFFVDSLCLIRDVCIIRFLHFSHHPDLRLCLFILFYWMLHNTYFPISTRAQKSVEIDMYNYPFMDITLTSHSHPILNLRMNWFYCHICLLQPWITPFFTIILPISLLHAICASFPSINIQSHVKSFSKDTTSHHA